MGRLKAERKDLASKPQDVPEFYKDKQWKRKKEILETSC